MSSDFEGDGPETQDGFGSLPTGRDDPSRRVVEGSPRGNAVLRGRRALYCNPAFARLLGLRSAADVLAVPDLYALLPDAERALMVDSGRQLRAGIPGAPTQVQFQFMRPDGAALWLQADVCMVEWEGGPAAHVTVRDITQMKRIEASRDLLAKAVDQAQDVVLITDAQGTILYANPAMAQATGYPLSEIIGANPRRFKSGSHDRAFYADMWKTLLAGETWSGRMTNRRQDGKLYQVESRISPVRDETGAITHYVGVQQDITKTLELEAQLHQALKVQTLGQLAGGVAHDFNNLLQVISGWTMLVLEELTPDHPHHRSLNRIDEAVQRGSGLTRQLLAMSRRSVMQARDVDLNLLLPGQMKMLGRLLGEQVELELVPGQDLANIHGDPGMIEQIVMNLSINARDAMPTGGRLVIETGNAELDEDFCHTHLWARPGSFVRLTVSDTGVGMTHEQQGHIFEPFFTTKELGKGTGLGLLTVATIVQQHDALIRVYSEPGLGSTFHVYFPAAARQGVAPVVPAGEIVRLGRGERILLVEDDTAVGEFMIEALRRGGYRVEHATDGQTAVDLMLRARTPFDLVILDMVLPKLTGRQVFELMTGLRLETRYLFSSGYSPHVMDVKFVLERNMQLLQKPYSPGQLLAAVGRAIGADKVLGSGPATAI